MTANEPAPPSEDQRQTFAALGVLRMPGLIPVELVDALRERIFARLDQAGLPRSGAWPSASDDAARRVVKSLRKLSGLQGLYTDALCATAEALLGGPAADRSGQLLLFTPPHADPVSHEPRDAAGSAAWRVPRTVWHTDCPRLPGASSPGIIALTYLDAVRPSGGGTVVVAGSHRLLPASAKKISSKQLKRALRRHAYFRALWSRDDGERKRLLDRCQRVASIPLRLQELSGEPGDAVLVDGRVLHSLAPNCLPQPRIMARGFFASDAMARSYGRDAA